MRMRNKISTALAGVKVWRKNIDRHDYALILIIPAYDEELISVLPCAVHNYFERKGLFCNKILVILHDPRVKEALRKMTDMEFAEITQKDIRRLMSYACLSAKHYGAPRKSNVKIITSELIYANQVQKIRDRELFTISDLITEMMLMRE